MKRLSIFLVFVMLVSALSLAGCGSSEKPVPDTPEEGAAVEESSETPLEEESSEESNDQLSENNPLVGTWYYEGNSVKDTYTFNADGTGKEIYVLSGNEVKHDITYTIEGNKINITFETGDKQTNEFEVSSDKLHIKTEYDDELDYDRVK